MRSLIALSIFNILFGGFGLVCAIYASVIIFGLASVVLYFTIGLISTAALLYVMFSGERNGE